MKMQITFPVDDVEVDYSQEVYPMQGDQATSALINHYTGDEHYLVASCEGDQFSVQYDTDAFFSTVVDAFGGHHPLVLSPDMIWLVVSQEFATYVKSNAEMLRSLFVDHQGKMELRVQSNTDIIHEPTDWEQIFSNFEKQLEKNTKGDLAALLVSDFSTSGPAERVASQITLMDTMSKYFDYKVFYCICGIPSITLRGKVEDWQHLRRKVMSLSNYGLGWWTEQLEPILDEFVLAAEGRPNRRFWQDIVSTKRPDYLRGKGCLPEKPTILDGWILKFFPFDHKGGIKKSVPCNQHMSPDLLRVPFKYERIGGEKVEVFSMELWAGFVGFIEHESTRAYEPKIGWLVRFADDQVASTK